MAEPPTSEAAPALANMSAPPRSVVTLPRLAPAAAMPQADTAAEDGAVAVSVGPGGGEALSCAVKLARLTLPESLCATLQLPLSDSRVAAPLGVARALVALARHAALIDGALGRGTPLAEGGADQHSTSGPQVHLAEAWRRKARRELGRVARLGEGALLQELAARLEEIPLAPWVPPVAVAISMGQDPCQRVFERQVPATPTHAVTCPLLTARLVAGIRGTVFLREAPPTLSQLLTLWSTSVPSGAWELWLPLAPARYQCVPSTDLNRHAPRQAHAPDTTALHPQASATHAQRDARS
jgi:hypothetical protein